VSSYSLAEAMTLRKMLMIVWIAPLCGGGLDVGSGVTVGLLVWAWS
jgi:hypothetical protein